MSGTLEDAGGQPVCLHGAAAGLTSPEVWVTYNPLLDKRYRHTALGPHITDWIARLETRGLADTSVDSYERTLSPFALMYPRLELGDVTASHIDQFLRRYRHATTREIRRRHIRLFFEWAVEWERLTKDPSKRIDRIKQAGRKRKDVFTENEIDQLMVLPVIDAVLVAILIGAGLRRGEALTLRATDLKLDDANPYIDVTGKGDKDREVDVDHDTAERIRELFFFEQLQPNDRVWYSRPGGGRVSRDRDCPRSTFDRWWRRCMKDAGVRYRHPHIARHTFATRWLRHGGSLEALSLQMGHASIKTTYDEYAHLDRRDVQRDLRIIEAARKRPGL